MFKNKAILLSMIIGVATLSGCKEDAGQAFVGHWYEVTNGTHPNDINITREGDSFHVDENRFYPVGLAKYRVSKMEAVAETDNVLKGDYFTMRIEGDHLMYKDETYVKK